MTTFCVSHSESGPGSPTVGMEQEELEDIMGNQLGRVFALATPSFSGGEELSYFSHISSLYWLKLSHDFGSEWIGWKSWPKKTLRW